MLEKKKHREGGGELQNTVISAIVANWCSLQQRGESINLSGVNQKLVHTRRASVIWIPTVSAEPAPTARADATKVKEKNVKVLRLLVFMRFYIFVKTHNKRQTGPNLWVWQQRHLAEPYGNSVRDVMIAQNSKNSLYIFFLSKTRKTYKNL